MWRNLRGNFVFETVRALNRVRICFLRSGIGMGRGRKLH